MTGGRRAWVLPAVLGLLLVAVLATATVLVLDRRGSLPEERAVVPAATGSSAEDSTPAEQAVARARLAARTYFTLDHASVEEDMDRLRALGTDAFVVDYDEMAQPLAQRVLDQRLQLSASLPRDGVATEYLSQNVAQLLVSVDVTTRRDPDPDAEVDGIGEGARTASTGAYRTRVLLQRVDDEWLVAGLDEVL